MMDAIGWMTRFGRRMLMVLRRGRFDADLEEEMRLPQELREQEQVERGVSPEERTTPCSDVSVTSLC